MPSHIWHITIRILLSFIVRLLFLHSKRSRGEKTESESYTAKVPKNVTSDGKHTVYTMSQEELDASPLMMLQNFQKCQSPHAKSVEFTSLLQNGIWLMTFQQNLVCEYTEQRLA